MAVDLEVVTEVATVVGLEVATVVGLEVAMEILTNRRAYLTSASITRIQGHRLEVVLAEVTADLSITPCMEVTENPRTTLCTTGGDS